MFGTGAHSKLPKSNLHKFPKFDLEKTYVLQLPVLIISLET